MTTEQDLKYLNLAIDNSRKSMEEGNFPAGAIVVLNDEVIASEVSSPYPGLFHADSKAVTKAFETKKPLGKATLYIGLESCLMCIGVTYWAGIRRIVYAVPKAKVSPNYYETPKDLNEVYKNFNEKIEFIHLEELEPEALDVIKQWEEKNEIR